MNTCLELPAGDRLGFPVKLEQRGSNHLRVTYGLQVRDRLGYANAARELGECIMHALACTGHLDNTDASAPFPAIRNSQSAIRNSP